MLADTFTSDPLASLVFAFRTVPHGRQDEPFHQIEQRLDSEKHRARAFTRVDGEAEQAVRLGILDAIVAFNEDRGVPFAPFARFVVRRRVAKETRQRLADAKTLALSDEGKPGTVEPFCARSRQAFNAVEDRLVIDDVRKRLTKSQNRFIDALEEHDFNAAEAARSLGLSASAGHKMLSRIQASVKAGQ